MTPYKLRKLFAEREIHRRTPQTKIQLTPSQLATRHRQRLEVFPKIIQAEQDPDQTIIYCDEAVFSCGQVRPKVWMAKGTPLIVERKKATFQAVAVVAGITGDGKVRAITTRKGAIDTEAFMDFMVDLRDAMGDAPFHLVLDNLPFHHAHVLKQHAERLQIHLIYNATYSSEVNPIERLWAFSKQLFAKACITFQRYNDHQAITNLVIQCIRGTPT